VDLNGSQNVGTGNSGTVIATATSQARTYNITCVTPTGWNLGHDNVFVTLNFPSLTSPVGISWHTADMQACRVDNNASVIASGFSGSVSGGSLTSSQTYNLICASPAGWNSGVDDVKLQFTVNSATYSSSQDSSRNLANALTALEGALQALVAALGH
jgi:hypothetical protein